MGPGEVGKRRRWAGLAWGNPEVGPGEGGCMRELACGVRVCVWGVGPEAGRRGRRILGGRARGSARLARMRCSAGAGGARLHAGGAACGARVRAGWCVEERGCGGWWTGRRWGDGEVARRGEVVSKKWPG